MTWPDYLLAAAAVAGLLAIGLRAGEKTRSLPDFLLAGRAVPVWAAAASFLATEVSATSLLALPAFAYRENWGYLQFFLGSAAARLVVAAFFIPAFYRRDCTTAYEYLRHRFGEGSQRAAALLFMVTRLLGSGVRLAAAGTAIAALLGWHPLPVILLLSASSAVYLGAGGFRAAVWTNVFQAAVFLGCGLATAAFLLANIDGGLVEALRLGAAAGRLDVARWGSASGEACLTGFFGSLAAFGTDHEFTQRMLCLKNRASSQRAMALAVLAGLFVTVLFLTIGTGLFAFYDQHPEMALPDSPERIYSHFAVQILPVILRGLFLSALVMASIDSPLASLSASFVVDFYRPIFGEQASAERCLKAARLSALLFGLGLALIAAAFGSWSGMSWLAFKIGAVTYGPLLGVFLWGLLGQGGSDRGSVAAMALAAAGSLSLLVLSERGSLALDWSWLIPGGALGTLILARIFSPGLKT